MTRRSLDPEQLDALFPAVRRASWRWECQPQYAVDAAELADWVAGRPVDVDEDRPWLSYIRGLRERGIPFERVRVVDEPLNTYQQWIAATTDSNVRAGEDIRWLPRARADALGMPTYDFYVFDAARLAILQFDSDGEMTGIVVDDDPLVVSEHLAYRDRVWTEATPHGRYEP